MSKQYNKKQLGKIIAKTIKRTLGKNPIQDVLDPDRKVEVDERTVPVPKIGVMYKSKSEKLKGFLEKRKNKVKIKKEQ